MLPSLHPDIERVALLGWRCVPIIPKGRAGFWTGYLDDATHDLDTLDRWSFEHPGCNWSVVPQGSGVWALDVDVPGPDHGADGVAALRHLLSLNGPLPRGPRGRSGGGGHLLVFRDDGHPLRLGSGALAPGLDARGGRCAFTISPSRKRGISPYRWVDAPWDAPLPPAPSWLLSALAPPPPPARAERQMPPTSDRAERTLACSFRGVAGAPRGTRNSALLRYATAMGGFVAAGAMDRAQAERQLIAAGMEAGQSRAEATSTVRSGLRRGEARPMQWGRA